IWHDRMGMSPDEIASEHDLTLGDVHAALAYYFDQQAEIDRQIQQEAAFVEELRERPPSVLARKLDGLKGGPKPLTADAPDEDWDGWHRYGSRPTSTCPGPSFVGFDGVAWTC